MNTDPKNINLNRAPSQPEPVNPDTNQKRKFEVPICFTQYKYADVTIEAASFAGAIEKACDLDPDAVKSWHSTCGQIEVDVEKFAEMEEDDE